MWLIGEFIYGLITEIHSQRIAPVKIISPSKFGGYGSDKIATAKNYAKT
ncbi:MAG: hypothetical protein KME46_23995 [Brasilonema angustatum HA4187-MV1]|jgi:hypothetical protein|nr:hypothetical protein [Brasilonema angustatum HA4187-MV1]